MKILVGFGSFIVTFLIYHLIGSSVFPVDENNILQAPDAYPIIGIALSAFVTFLSVRAWNRLKASSNKNRSSQVYGYNENRMDFSAAQAPKFSASLAEVDAMEGHAFEHWCADLLRKNGFTDVEVTPGSGDHGVDVLAVKDGVHYAVQCKCYSHDLGNTPVQEVFAGKEMYKCQVGVVMTNRYFTSGAKSLAEQTRVLLWDRDKIQSLIESAT